MHISCYGISCFGLYNLVIINILLPLRMDILFLATVADRLFFMNIQYIFKVPCADSKSNGFYMLMMYSKKKYFICFIDFQVYIFHLHWLTHRFLSVFSGLCFCFSVSALLEFYCFDPLSLYIKQEGIPHSPKFL